MSLLNIKKYNFNIKFFETRFIYPFYSNVYNKSNQQNFLNPNQKNCPGPESTIHIVHNINPYFDLKLNRNTPLSVFKLSKNKGFMAVLRNYEDVDEYMKIKMSPKSRTKIRGYARRLETCFNIRYQMYYDEITWENYEYLFKKLHSFIINRFKERGDNHQSLDHWDFLEKNTYEMILEKKASLFVIYNGDVPIDICLNNHHQNILDNAIRSYDISYSKFRLGYIDILKQLEWCFENGVTIFDLSYGDFEYKRKWCNEVYSFETQILYNNSRLVYKAIAFGIMQFYRLKEYLIKKNIHLFYHKLRKLLKREKRVDSMRSEVTFQIIEMKIRPDLETISEIDYHMDEYAFLKRHIYDFQYLNFEHTKNIKVYKFRDQPDTFIISGKNQKLKIAIIS